MHKKTYKVHVTVVRRKDLIVFVVVVVDVTSGVSPTTSFLATDHEKVKNGHEI